MRGEPRYSPGAIDRLVEGYAYDADRLVWADVSDASWIALRSRVEESGECDAEGLLEVIDLERAVTALQRSHPDAALLVLGTMHAWSMEEMEHALARLMLQVLKEEGLDRSRRQDVLVRLKGAYSRKLDQAEAFMSAYLSGTDPESAWRRGGSRRRER